GQTRPRSEVVTARGVGYQGIDIFAPGEGNNGELALRNSSQRATIRPLGRIAEKDRNGEAIAEERLENSNRAIDGSLDCRCVRITRDRSVEGRVNDQSAACGGGSAGHVNAAARAARIVSSHPIVIGRALLQLCNYSSSDVADI